MLKYRILEKKDDAVLLVSLGGGNKVYMVRDIEDDAICMTHDYETAKVEFDNYSIEKTRKEKEKMFHEWIAEFVQA